MLLARSFRIACSFPIVATIAAAQSPLFREANRMLPRPEGFTSSGVVDDFDGDGSPDVFVASPLGDHQLYLNDGNGAFRDASSRVPRGTYARAAAAGDVDGDGDADLLLAAIDSGPYGFGAQNQLLLNTPSGFADATSQLPALANESQDVLLVDVDGDGDLDAIVANIPYCSPISGFCVRAQNRLYVNDGAGVFTDETTRLPIDEDSTRALAAGDLDGDGDLDLLLVNDRFAQPAVGGQDRFYFNDGSGTFFDVPLLPPDMDDGADGLLADLDDDGDLDIWIGNDGSQDTLLRNDGHLIVDVTDLLPQAANAVEAATFGDLDGDDLPELLIASGSSAPCRLYRNEGGLAFVDASTALPPGLPSSRWVALRDLDADGDADALLLAGPALARLLLNDGALGLRDATDTTTLASSSGTLRARALAMGDVDGDGDRDIVFATYAQPTTRLYLNDDVGRFTDATATNLPGTTFNAGDAILDDLDGDGDLDLIVTAGTSEPNQLYLNDGAGVFADATPASGLGTSGGSILAGDLDGDGDVDVVLRTNELYRNAGNATFTYAPGAIPAFTSGTSAALGDVDGDGDLDLFVGRGSSPGFESKLLINDGSGSFTDQSTRLPSVTGVGLSVAARIGDVDGDGDLDIFCSQAAFPAPPSLLYLNDGTGTFGDASAQVPAILENKRTAVMFDADGDGDLDVVEGNSGTASLYLNDGAGAFEDASSRLDIREFELFELAVADLDGDGDQDLVCGGDYNLWIADNQTRHLSWRGLPRVGKPLDLEVAGEGDTFFAIAFALSPASVPLARLGLLRLDPGSLMVFSKGALDPTGSAVVRILPSLAVPVGTTLYVQAVVGQPLRFTNLETVVMSAF